MTQALTSPPLRNHSAIAHGFFTRDGGVSTGLYATLNTGFGSDDRGEAVSENRARIANAMGVPSDRLVTAHQAHTATAIVVTNPWSRADAPIADAMATSERGLALAVLTADCLPILLSAPEAGVIAAIHAGWRGALAGVIEAGIDAMRELGARPEQVAAAIGPALQQDNFEVGLELVDAFTEDDPQASRFFSPGAAPNKRQLDLAAYAAARLRRAGVDHVHDLGLCTYADERQFFSYRRARHRNEPDYGRNLSAICLS